MTGELFGAKTFGSFLFGAGTITRPRFTLEIDWDQDGFFDGRNDAIWANALAWERGRRFTITTNGDGFEEEMTGKLMATIVDTENWYDPYSNPLLGAGKLFRLKVHTPSDMYFDLMAGTINEPVYQTGRGVPRVQISGEDGWGFLRDQRNRATIDLQENIYADEAMHLLLDAVGWARAWGRDIGDGQDVHPFWWADDKSPSKALHELAFSEMGRVWMSANGSLAFRNRHVYEDPTITIRDAEVHYGSVKTLEPWDVVRNSVRVEARPRELVSNVELWRSIDAVRLVPGERYEKFVDFTYNGSAAPVKAITQPVAGSDYIANTQIDGSGVNITAAISATVDFFSTRGKLTLRNNGSQAGYVLVPLKIRGDALAMTTTSFESVDEESVRTYGTRSLDLQYEWVQNVNLARYMARKLMLRYAQPKKHLEFEIRANPDLQFALDLGTVFEADLTSQGIAGNYRVYALRSQWADKAGMSTRTVVQAEPVESPSGLWTVPGTVPVIVG